MVVGRTILSPFTVDAPWARPIGAGVLVVSTLFAIWARLALGSSWSVDPEAAADRGLRIDGPYAITRHPIYTGLLGMLLGSALVGDCWSCTLPSIRRRPCLVMRNVDGSWTA